MRELKNLKILFVSAEVSPFAKTGGLADVAGSLPRSLTAMGHDVRIAMPRYKSINHVAETRTDFPVVLNDRKETAIIREGYLDANLGEQRIPVYFVDNYHYFDRDNLYCYADEAERFAFFCRAVVGMLPKLDFKPDVIHCNDWQSGPIPVMIREQALVVPFYREIATVFTVHNLHYQGNYSKDSLMLLGLNQEYYNPDKLEFYGDVSYLKAGLIYADIINTVSKTYAQEIQTPEFGEGLDGLMRKRATDLYGIINGIDYCDFDPATDSCIMRNYDHQSVELKRDNKDNLQKTMKLPIRNIPLLGLVSRLVDQKGLDLLEDIFDQLIKEDIQFVVLGSGDPHYEDFFKQMAARYPDKVAIYVGFNAPLAQQIYAGSDMFLMPSKFEPCGLGQLISLRYGTIPIVRATGGLADTVSNYDVTTKEGNGFVFREYKSSELFDAIQRALFVYREKTDLWSGLVKEAMSSDFSWSSAAKDYIKLYNTAIKKEK